VADTGIATRLRSAGLDVREVDGWKTRGREFVLGGFSFHPEGGVNHHTAGHPTKDSPIPSLGVVIHGRSDLPGPLANVFFGFNRKFYVVAAGVCNHAGLPDGGVCRGMTGNSTAYGMEIEHDGLHPLPDDMVRLAARAWAAIFRKDDLPASQLVQHHEWAPSRKIDLATNMHETATPAPSANAYRSMVAAEKKNLERVSIWVVSYKKGDGTLVERTDGKTTKDPVAWAKNNPGAYQRGAVKFYPKRRA
jgi:hypothetical protein